MQTVDTGKEGTSTFRDKSKLPHDHVERSTLNYIDLDEVLSHALAGRIFRASHHDIRQAVCRLHELLREHL